MAEKKLIYKYLCRINLFILLAILFVVFYMQDQMSDYLLKRTTIATRFEEKDTLVFPTLTACMTNGQKTSVARKFGVDMNWELLYDADILERSNSKNISEVRNQLSYILNRDFEIVWITTDMGQLTEKHTQLKEGKNKLGDIELDVEPIFSMRYLTCYKIQMNPGEVRMGITALQFLQTVENPEDRSKGIELLLSSNNTWMGITRAVWPQFKPTIDHIPFDSGFHELKLSHVDHRFQSGVNDTRDCVTALHDAQNCSIKCSILSYDNLPPCQFPNESICMLQSPYANFSEFSKCFFYKNFLTFDVAHVKYPNHTMLESPSIWPSSMVTMSIFLWSPKMEIKEEIRIITESSLIGSLGGSLGMFFGLSFFTHLNFILEKLIDHIIR